MGNLCAESGLVPANLQNTYELGGLHEESLHPERFSGDGRRI